MNLKQLIFIIQIILIRKTIRWNASPNTAYAFHKYKEISSGPNVTNTYRNATKSSQHHQATIGSMADLYFFSSQDVMGIFNCSYENTINITNNEFLPNGSYIYDDQTLIPPQLVGDYDYEILYNGTRRKVPKHKRACICHLKPCITLCDNDILENYQHAINTANYNALEIFSIDMTLTNGTVVTRNIAEDFEPIVLKEFCESFYTLSPEMDGTSYWTLFENGTLLQHSNQVKLKRTEYCFDMHNNITYDFINPMVCGRKNPDLALLEKLNYIIQVPSILLLLLTIIAYCCLPELLDVHGKCFITYVSSLAISFSIYVFFNVFRIKLNTVPCLLMAYLNQYFQLSYYIWLGIICFHTWRSFSNPDYSVSFYKYALFGYSCPFLMTLLTAWAQNMNIHKSWKPGITSDRCGLNVYSWAAIIYMYGPCFIILVCCFIFFILTSWIINNYNNDVATIVFRKTRYTLYLRLFLMMGLSWFCDVLSYLVNVLNLKLLSAVLDYVNALQGLYIFVAFIFRERVQKMIREKIWRWKRSRELRCTSLEIN